MKKNKRKNKTILKIVIIMLLVTIISFIGYKLNGTLARYESDTKTERKVDVAFFVVDNNYETKTLALKDLYPRELPFEYEIDVSNFKENKIAESDIEYDLIFETTTNLPLEYEIQKNGKTCTNFKTEIKKDLSGTYKKEMKFAVPENPYPQIIDTIIPKLGQSGEQTGKYEKTKVTDKYILKVKFPKENNEHEEYADLIESVKISISARQRIGEK